jgi:hypothetical protein
MIGKHQTTLFLIVTLAAGVYISCKIDQPTVPTTPPDQISPPPVIPTTSVPGSSSALTAPNIVSPVPGAQLNDVRPVLTIENATTTNGMTPSYAFMVATDQQLIDIVDRTESVPQGINGQTSWQVTQALESGRYYWGAQARTGPDYGPPSQIVNFTIGGGTLPPEVPPGTPPGTGVLISDSLLGFSTQGEVQGGVFTQQGWQVTRQTDFIRYVVPPIESGWVEWNNHNLYPFNQSPDQYVLFGMWDPSRGDYRANPYRVHIQKLDSNHNQPYVRLRWIANGEQHDRGYNFMNWDPRRLYNWRIEWGPSANRNEARVYLDGQLIIVAHYDNDYSPETHWIELGVEERQESVVGAIYSNFRVGTN